MQEKIGMRKAKLHIVSVTKNEDGESRLEQWEDAEVTEKNGKHYAFFQEHSEGMENVKTILKWDNDCVVISRSGGVENRQEYRQGITTASVYKTLYLEIPLKVTTHKLQVTDFDKGQKIEIHYLLCHDEKPYGEMEIVLNLEEEK